MQSLQIRVERSEMQNTYGAPYGCEWLCKKEKKETCLGLQITMNKVHWGTE